MWLIFCGYGDKSASWICDGLSRIAPGPVELVTTEDVEFADYFKHSLGADFPSFDIRLTDGRRLHSDHIKATVNRAPAPSSHWMSSAGPGDGPYVYSEFQAIHMSWLYGLTTRMVNRPSPIGLCGPWMHPVEWRAAASKCGLRIAPCRIADCPVERPIIAADGGHQSTVLMLGRQFFGMKLPRAIRTGCVKLARTLQIDLLGIRFERDTAGEWLFVDATPCPDLTAGGEEFLEALASTLSASAT